MKLKIFVLAILSVMLLTGCGVTRYNEPSPSEKSALLIIDQSDPLMRLGQPFALSTNVYIDGKYVDAYKFSNMRVKVREGKHIISLDMSAYYNNRAKHNTTKEYEVEFKANEHYKIVSSTASKTLQNHTDDVMAKYAILGEDTLVEDSILLEDSAMRSLVGNQEAVQRDIVDAVIQTVVLPAM